MSEMLAITMTGHVAAARWFRTKRGSLIPIVTPAFQLAGRRVIAGMQEGYQSRGNVNSYIRTGTYGRKFQQRLTATINRIRVNIYNLTPYAKWVGAAETQASVHRGRWPTDRQILRREADDIVQEVSGALIRGLY